MTSSPVSARQQVRRFMLPRRTLAALTLASTAADDTAAAEAPASFVMLERRDCPWCRRWHREVGAASWNGSNLGRRAPLRRVDLAEGMPEDLRQLAAWRFTPTFVLMTEGRSVGQIIGYQGDLFFWQQAEALFTRLPEHPKEENRR